MNQSNIHTLIIASAWVIILGIYFWPSRSCDCSKDKDE